MPVEGKSGQVSVASCPDASLSAKEPMVYGQSQCETFNLIYNPKTCHMLMLHLKPPSQFELIFLCLCHGTRGVSDGLPGVIKTCRLQQHCSQAMR